MRPNTRSRPAHTTSAVVELPVVGSWLTEPTTDVPLGEPPPASTATSADVSVVSPRLVDVLALLALVEEVLPPVVVEVVDDVVEVVVVVEACVAVHVIPAG